MKIQNTLLIGVMVAVMLLTIGAVCVSALTPTSVIVGDLDRDARINSQDVRVMLVHIVGTRPLDALGMKQADINGDGKVNTIDAHALLKWIAYDAASTAPTITVTTTTVTTPSTTTTTHPSIDDDGYYDDVVKP